MELLEFLKEVENLFNCGWNVRECAQGSYRLYKGNERLTNLKCPITAVAKEKLNLNYNVTSYYKAAEKLGLSEKLSNDITRANDNPISNSYRRNLQKIYKDYLG